MQKFPIPKLFVVVLSLVSLAMIASVVLIELNKPDISPDDSSALFGGTIAPNEYPYAGYVLSYASDSNASLCGITFLNSKIAISAAHCFENKINAYIGTSVFDFDIDQNYIAQDVIIHPAWDSKNVDRDIAIIRLPTNFPPVNSYAQIASPDTTCNYEVLGYGKTENDHERPQLEKLRKKAQFCIEKIEDDKFFLKGKDGGVCFGDSGSPVFEKGTNKIVGVISSIVTTAAQANSPCAVSNRAVAVRIDANLGFVTNTTDMANTTGELATCGQSCRDRKCAYGLVCDLNSQTCVGANKTCTVSAMQYCSDFASIKCENQHTCILNRCITSTQSGTMKQRLEADISEIKNIATDTTIQTDQIIEINTTQKSALSIAAISAFFSLFGFIYLKRTQSNTSYTP